MVYVVIGYAVFILGFIVYEVIKEARFMRYKKAMNATLVADRFYMRMTWILTIALIIQFAGAMITTLNNIDQYIANPSLPLPFAFYAMAPFCLFYKLLVPEGLYAYTEEVLINFGKQSIPFSDLTIEKAYLSWPYVIKAVVKPNAQSKHANKKIVIRTMDKHNFYRLQSLINAENA
jgi:hypothetical protein